MENDYEGQLNDWTPGMIRTLMRTVFVLWNGDFQDMLEEPTEKILDGWTAVNKIMEQEFPGFKSTPRQICCKYQELLSDQESRKDPIDMLLEISRESQKTNELNKSQMTHREVKSEYKLLQDMEHKNQELSNIKEKKRIQNEIKMLKEVKEAKEAELNQWRNILHKVENDNYEDITPHLK